jgi:hypothetical protein
MSSADPAAALRDTRPIEVFRRSARARGEGRCALTGAPSSVHVPRKPSPSLHRLHAPTTGRGHLDHDPKDDLDHDPKDDQSANNDIGPTAVDLPPCRRSHPSATRISTPRVPGVLSWRADVATPLVDFHAGCVTGVVGDVGSAITGGVSGFAARGGRVFSTGVPSRLRRLRCVAPLTPTGRVSAESPPHRSTEVRRSRRPSSVPVWSAHSRRVAGGDAGARCRQPYQATR